MSWYYTAIEILCWVFVFLMLRHGLYRGMYLLHIFQQHGYKFNEFTKWLAGHWNTILVSVPHLALILAAMVGRYYLEPYFTTTAVAVALFIFSAFWFGSIARFHGSKVKKPLVFTARMKRLTLVFIVLAAWIPLLGTAYAFSIGPLFPDIYILIYVWVLADLLLPWLLFLAAGIVHPLENLVQFRYIRMARNKLQSMSSLKVIAITGSYGKTSTKFLIDAVLKERFRVCTTPGSYNTPMGICKVINHDLQPSDQVLILEMGARYEGNIDELCRIARPDIAVVTNVGIAHLESFGSLEAIARTKGALMQYVKTGGIAVLNGDDPKVRSMAGRKDIDVLFAGLEEEYNHLIARNITYDENGCSFQILLSEQHLFPGEQPAGTKGPEQIVMSHLGEHSVRNALLAAGVGLMAGLRLPTIKVALRKVKPVEHRLELKKQNGVLIIDDAFNSNPIGAKNAISVLCSFESGRKFVVTPGMIELGDRQEEENREFGLWMAKKAPDHIYLIGRQQTEPVYEGLKQGGFDEQRITVVDTLFEANDRLRTELVEGDVVLYENDLPDSYNE